MSADLAQEKGAPGARKRPLRPSAEPAARSGCTSAASESTRTINAASFLRSSRNALMPAAVTDSERRAGADADAAAVAPRRLCRHPQESRLHFL